MTLPTNDQVSMRELSTEELDTIAAAGGSNFLDFLKHEVRVIVHDIERILGVHTPRH
jgi:hypothetical protein